MLGKYRSRCSQSAIGWNTGPPMEELEKVTKELYIFNTVSHYIFPPLLLPGPAANFSSLGTFSSSSIGGPVYHPVDDCEHPLPYLPGTGIASQEKAISGSCQQNFIGNGVWVWWLYMRWIPRWDSLWMVLTSVSTLTFGSVTPSMDISFPILRRSELSTLPSS